MKRFLSFKDTIAKRLEEILVERSKEFSSYSYATDLVDKLLPFSTNGKMVRGCLFLRSYELLGNSDIDSVVDVACAIELLHSGFLIQDDIMDGDVKRRGMDCIHIQYQNEGLAMCLGDIAFSLAFKILASYPKAVSFMSSIMTRTCFGQMLDEKIGLANRESVKQVYEAKTAYYTFYLPFHLASLLSQDSSNDSLLSLSKALGMIFQITDDRLGYNGDATLTGKGVGTDINAQKYTLYILHLFDVVSTDEREELERIYSEKNVSDADITYVMNLCSSYDIDSFFETELNKYVDEVHSLVSSDSFGKFVLELTDYLVKRKK